MVPRQRMQDFVLSVLAGDVVLAAYYDAYATVFSHTEGLGQIWPALDPVPELYEKFNDETTKTGLLTEALVASYLIDLRFISKHIVNTQSAEVWQVEVEQFDQFLSRLRDPSALKISDAKGGDQRRVSFFSWVSTLCNFEEAPCLIGFAERKH